MSYTVLARRYRSRDFDEIVGQEPIARTLRNAIDSNRIAHAYLFCGTRGVGKTSMARIFAKALNVSPDLAQADEIAASILRGDDLDVIEIDGASYRGINEAKELIAGAGLSPARCRYKIYIIDEVHQLTRDAFNALLKTMEEPPQHVKFILCTTEAHKVPATIQSRCQRFDFRPIATPQIAAQLQKILDAEGVTAEEAVVHHVARLGHGSMRDALSLLDRLLAAGQETLSFQLLEQMLGLPDQARVAEVIDAVAAGDAAAALERGDHLLATGLTEEAAIDLLAERYRDLMVIAACGRDSSLVDLSSDEMDHASEQASHFDAAGLVHLIAICDAVARNVRGSAIGRALFDAAIVRMADAEHLADLAALLEGRAEPARQVVEAKKKEPTAGREEPVRRRSSAEPPSAEAPAVAVAPRGDRPAPRGDRATGAASQLIESKPAGGGDQAGASGPDLWARVVREASGSASDQAKVDHLHFESFDGRTLRLAIDPEGAPIARWLGTQGEWLSQLVLRATGQRVRVELDTSRLAPRATGGVEADAVEEARRMPAVRQAMDLFDAVVVDVQEVVAERSPDEAPGGSDEHA